MITTRLTSRFGLSVPVVLAPMAKFADGRLAAAVTKAGGLGLLGAGYDDAAWLNAQFATAGDTRVGVGFIAWKLAERPELLDAVLAHNPAAVALSFGDPTPFASKIRDANVPLFNQINDLEEARRGIDIGADVLIAQGGEAGGHGKGIRSTFTLVPEAADLVADRAPSRDTYLAKVRAEIANSLQAMKINATVEGRPKHYWSIYQKMIVKGRDFDDIHDLVGVRILCDEIRDCYAAVGVVHSLWQPMAGRFKDYIAQPRFGVYQSLHTTVVGPEGKPLEVQIRTRDMHRTAEYGIAAHWRYKEAKGRNGVPHPHAAAEIDARDSSYPVDMRMVIGEAKIRAVDLPPALSQRLLALMRRLGLVYGAIDLKQDEHGDYYFLEVNPAGQWQFVESRAGLPITQAHADALRRMASAQRRRRGKTARSKGRMAQTI